MMRLKRVSILLTTASRAMLFDSGCTLVGILSPAICNLASALPHTDWDPVVLVVPKGLVVDSRIDPEAA